MYWENKSQRQNKKILRFVFDTEAGLKSSFLVKMTKENRETLFLLPHKREENASYRRTKQLTEPPAQITFPTLISLGIQTKLLQGMTLLSDFEM